MWPLRPLLAEGTARNRLHLTAALWRQKILFRLDIGQPANIARTMR